VPTKLDLIGGLLESLHFEAHKRRVKQRVFYLPLKHLTL